jgi:uncharacterized membrane protein
MSRNHYVWAVVFTVAALAFSSALYPSLPDRIPTHWNGRGEVDGYGAKQWAAFLGPIMMGGMILVFRFLPWLSPRQFEVEGFRPTYLYIMLTLVMMFGYIHGIALWKALGGGIDLRRALFGGLFLFLASLGNVLGKVRRNFYVGVRTPWTLASEKVWYATHRVAAWTFALGGVLGFVLVVAGGWFVSAGIVVGVALLTPVVHSLVYYKRLEAAGRL